MKLQISGLYKTYPNGVRALDGIDLTIQQGMFGLLGPNGAGKSSLMRTIATLQKPDKGTILFDDIDVLTQPERLRQTLGYLPQDFGFYPNLSAEATLDHFAVLKGLANSRDRRETVKRLLAQTNLYEVRNKSVGGFSGGMRQRLGIAIALLGNPRLIIVDEPTAGLDPTERNRFLNLLSEVGENVIVILSTHIVEDVRELCSQTAIIARGQVVAHGDPESVIGAVAGSLWKRVFTKPELDAALSRYRVISTRLVAGKPVIVAFSTDGPPDEGFSPVEADLADAYFFYTTPTSTTPAPAPQPVTP